MMQARTFALAAVLGMMGAALCGCGGGGGSDDKPTTTPLPTTTVTTTNPNCLCMYDVDRTLTAAQKLDCPNTTVIDGIPDNAYGGGTLKLAQVSTHMNDTFCTACMHGIITRGDVDGVNSKERSEIINDVMGGAAKLGGVTTWQQWVRYQNVSSPLQFFTDDGKKQEAAAKIREWYSKNGYHVEPYHVFFFDDREDNVKGFENTGMNAKQIACAARDPTKGRENIGKCGATVKEIVMFAGIQLCATQPSEVTV